MIDILSIVFVLLRSWILARVFQIGPFHIISLKEMRVIRNFQPGDCPGIVVKKNRFARLQFTSIEFLRPWFPDIVFELKVGNKIEIVECTPQGIKF